MLRYLGVSLEQLETSVIVSNGLHTCRALRGLLPGFVPIMDGLLRKPGFRKMMRQYFGLRPCDLRRLRLQGVGNLLMYLLLGAP